MRKPVSYTHLDVYKRQGILRHILQERTPKIVEFTKQDDTRATSANYLAELLQGVAPVALVDLQRSSAKSKL